MKGTSKCSMPKGKKFSNGYITTDEDSANLRVISEIMGKHGFKMGHATVRNIILKLMQKFAKAILTHSDEQTDESIKRIASDPRFQSAIGDLIRELNEKSF